MTKEEYYSKLDSLKKEMELMEQQIVTEYALTNNHVKIGDIVTDHRCTIKVEKIIPCRIYGDLPICLYSGQRYTKKLVPAKKKETETVYQSNLMYINGKKYSID